MEKLLRLLFDNPVLLMVVLAWLVGAIGNAVRRGVRGAASRPESRRPSTSPPPLQRREPSSVRKTPDQVAAEMRRILGLDTVEVVPEQPVVRPVHRETIAVERPPEPVHVSTRDRRLELHVASHVGEELQRRKDPHSGLVGTQRIGDLGGRTTSAPRMGRTTGRLVDLGDLKRAVLAAEILGPPLALREERQRGG